MKEPRSALVLPTATGMSLTLVLLTLRLKHPSVTALPPSARAAKRHVLWLRIDQKSCLKAIATAGCVPVVVLRFGPGEEAVGTVPAYGAEASALTASALGVQVFGVCGDARATGLSQRRGALLMCHPARLRPVTLAAGQAAADRPEPAIVARRG